MAAHTKVTARKVSGYGWRPDLPDQNDFLFTAEPDVMKDLPTTVDLRPQMPAIYDQSQLGSCTANDLAAAVEFEMMKQKLAAYTPSRLFIYYNERAIEGTVDSDAGAMLRDGLKTLHKDGAPPETLWPYDIAKFAQRPPQEAYTAGLEHQVVSYHRVTRSTVQMQACLAAGYPFSFGFTVYDNFESPEVAKTGILTMPTSRMQMLGGHAVLCVGYFNTTPHGPMWIVRNSWGPGWGQAGYFLMPMPYLLSPQLSSDFWTIRLVEAPQAA